MKRQTQFLIMSKTPQDLRNKLSIFFPTLSAGENIVSLEQVWVLVSHQF